MRGYDAWKTRTPVDESVERCVRDDSTECVCERCRDDEDRFWEEQGEGDRDDESANDWPLAREVKS